ncbi:MAG: DUF1810 domain-containing protein [Burkholderiales bacterium]
MSPAPTGLERFLRAQESVYDTALAELAAGRKETHWMWFILPQLRGLGRSERARFYGIGDLREAAAYLAHPLLGPRLVACVTAMLGHPRLPADAILGGVDALKFRSCLTLFSRVPAAPPVFTDALRTFYGGEPDPGTLQLLAGEPPLGRDPG